MIQKFAEVHTMSVHVLFGSMKVLSFTPENAVTGVCMHVHGDHAFFVNDPHTKSVIAKIKLTKPEFRPDVVLKVLPKNPDADTSASEWLITRKTWVQPGWPFTPRVFAHRCSLTAAAFQRPFK